MQRSISQTNSACSYHSSANYHLIAETHMWDSCLKCTRKVYVIIKIGRTNIYVENQLVSNPLRWKLHDQIVSDLYNLKWNNISSEMMPFPFPP